MRESFPLVLPRGIRSKQNTVGAMVPYDPAHLVLASLSNGITGIKINILAYQIFLYIIKIAEPSKMGR